MTKTIRIATRKSPLALWQAEHVAHRLEQAHPDLRCELVKLSTIADRFIDRPLSRIGGKGLFVKELEKALLDGSADLAVHSMKDVPVEFPEGLTLAVVLKGEDPGDAFVCNKYESVESLPEGARVGTSSLRRRCQLSALRPDLEVLDLRGNVNTRLRRLDEGDFDAIILACAGLQRLGFNQRIRASIPYEIMLPAIGQGVIGIECREGDAETRSLLAPLHDTNSEQRLLAERAVNARLGGSCQLPLAAHAEFEGDQIYLRALVGEADGSRILKADGRADRSTAHSLGLEVAESLLSQGAGDVLAKIAESQQQS